MVRIFDLQYSEEFKRRFREGCETIWQDGHLTQHRFVREFEAGFARWLGVSQAVAVCNGTAALEVAIRALNLSGRILVPTNTFIASALAVLRAGCKPLIVDTDDWGQLSLSQIETVADRHSDLVAVMIVPIGGLLPRDTEGILRYCAQKNLRLIEDAAHGHGSKWRGRPVGTLGDAAGFSFHQTKIMTTGEGGMVTARGIDTLERATRLRMHGRSSSHPLLHDDMGYNFKMSEFCGLLGCLELERAEERMARRRWIHEVYHRELAGVQGLQVLSASEGSEAGYYKQIMISEQPRERILRAFEDAEISMTNGVYYHPLHRQPVLRDWISEDRRYHKADAFADKHFCPPCYPELTESSIGNIVDTLKRVHQ